MKTIELPIDHAQADLEEMCRLHSEGKHILDLELSRCVTQRADEARADALRLLGI